MILNTYKEMERVLESIYEFPSDLSNLLFIWAQCVADQSWNAVNSFTDPNNPDADKLRRRIKRLKPFFLEELGINTASLKPTAKNLFAAAYINGFLLGYQQGCDNTRSAKQA